MKIQVCLSNIIEFSLYLCYVSRFSKVHLELGQFGMYVDSNSIIPKMQNVINRLFNDEYNKS